MTQANQQYCNVIPQQRQTYRRYSSCNTTLYLEIEKPWNDTIKLQDQVQQDQVQQD